MMLHLTQELEPPANPARFIMDFILQPENAAMISNFARYANGVSGSEAFMDPEMATAPEVVIPDEHKAAGVFMPVCSETAREYMTAIWTELQK
jgi:spermidine/putrescine transport system substrate-binding protein